MNGSRVLVGALVVVTLAFGLGACGAGDETSTAAPSTTGSAPQAPGRQGLRDARYCEVLPFVRERLTVKAGVYNTLGFNDCPADLWDALTEDEVNEAYGSMSAKLNGPRHMVMDSSVASGASADGDVFNFGGIEMQRRATLEMSALGDRPGSDPYSPTEVERETIFTFDAGKPVFELTSPEGEVYVMQSYAQIVDPGLDYSDLATIGGRLSLPEGWTYSTRVLDEEIRLDSGGLAFVIQDDLLNSYQRRT